jgi:hypothetical protein
LAVAAAAANAKGKETMTGTIGRDTNGNKVVRIKRPGMRGFSIQTNGNLPMCHGLSIGHKIPYTKGNQQYWVEIQDFIGKYGTSKQKEMVGK